MSSTGPDHPQERADIRPPWSRSDRRFPTAILGPLRSFLQTEAASGVLLVVAALAALVWANSPWRDSYERLWQGTSFTVRLGGLHLSETLRHWVNEGLMTAFFLVVGLEIKRELRTGELRDRRAALLPAVAALGGMIVPALVYLAFNAGGPAARGWGIPMATDIAFALGVTALAMPRALSSLRLFLLTLAIVDDLGAIIVVALFYSDGVAFGWLAVAALVVVAIAGLERIHVRARVVFVALGAGLWLALRAAGISPTLAGVAMGFLTPAVAFQRPRSVSAEAHRVADETVDDPSPPDADAPQWLYLAGLAREAVSPLARLESALHPWTSYVVIPLFALANAGVTLSVSGLGRAATSRVAVGIVLATTLGKVLGIVGACALAVRLGVARLPAGTGWRHIVGVAAAAGIPFTVSLFIAELAFGSGGTLEAAKLGILAAAVLAGVAGFVLLRRAERGQASGAVPR